MEKLVCVIMGQNCDRFIQMCYKSVKESDAIVFCDGGSSDGTIDYLKSNGFKWEPSAYGNKKLIYQNYNQLDKKMNGKQRNFYLNYVKNKYPDYWCLAIDADEVVEDLSKIKEIIQVADKGLISIKMRHLIQDLAHEDATQEQHFVLNRLFKINKADKYPETEHPVLTGKVIGATDCTTIWHMAYCPNLFEIKKRYENHLLKSEMHTPKYLHDWYYSHLFGTYPKKEFCIDQLPEIILNEFGIDKDEIYFENRKSLETKHFIDAIYLREWLSANIKDPKVIDFGCGMGLRIWAMNKVGLKSWGNELSPYAISHSLFPAVIKQGDITKGLTKFKGITFDLSMAYDVLEHLKYEELDKGINTLIKNTKKYIILSIPYKGTPNCEMDKTHIIKESREWWLDKFLSKKLKEVKVPEHFLFKEQLLIFEK